MKEYYVYIMTNTYNTTYYVGVTNDITRRVEEHKSRGADSFTKKYNLTKLVYYETHDSIDIAINREKSLKKWKHKWKTDLIKSVNPEFKDLYETI